MLKIVLTERHPVGVVHQQVQLDALAHHCGGSPQRPADSQLEVVFWAGVGTDTDKGVRCVVVGSTAGTGVGECVLGWTGGGLIG